MLWGDSTEPANPIAPQTVVLYNSKFFAAQTEDSAQSEDSSPRLPSRPLLSVCKLFLLRDLVPLSLMCRGPTRTAVPHTDFTALVVTTALDSI
jgi:hypothetical protein